MNPTFVAMIVFACTLGGAMIGNRVRTALPEHHLSSDSRDAVNLGIGLVAMMTALVLGLVTASAKSSFDALDTMVKHTAMDVIALDRLLARYGPETGGVRAALQSAVANRTDTIWQLSSSPSDGGDPVKSGATFALEGFADGIRSLAPGDDSQRALKVRALDLSESLLQSRWLVFAGGGTSVPVPFLAVLLFWLTITFASFGIFAPRNVTVLAAFFVCALSVSSAVFLILEMDGPFDGLLRVSAEPLRYAIAHMNQ